MPHTESEWMLSSVSDYSDDIGNQSHYFVTGRMQYSRNLDWRQSKRKNFRICFSTPDSFYITLRIN